MQQNVFSLHESLEAHHWWFKARRKIVFSIIDRLMAQRTTDLILDVGCGTGGTVVNLATKYRCVGIDTSLFAIQRARENYPSCEFRVDCVLKALKELRNEVGLLVLMDVLEHIENDADFLSEIIEIAKPSTNILITVPAKQHLWSQHDVSAGHFRRYEINNLFSLWKNSAVNTRLLSYYNVRLYPIVRLVRLIKQHFQLFNNKGHTDFFTPPALLNWGLMQVFSSETKSIANQLDQPLNRKTRNGVSLIAVIEKT